jgi:hypothetical protein
MVDGKKAKMHLNLLKSTVVLELNDLKIRGKFMQASPIEVQKSLKDIDYPVHKKELIQHAKKRGASEKVLAVLESLPNKEYTNAVSVSQEFKGK